MKTKTSTKTEVQRACLRTRATKAVKPQSQPQRNSILKLLPGEIVLYLEDHGQDFLYFIVNDDVITGCGPFQASVWVGQKIYPTRWRKGSQIVFKASDKALNYRVLKVER